MQTLLDLRIYRLAEELSDDVYELTKNFKSFDNNTLGIQMVRAADSVGANIAEGFGRFHYGEDLSFLFYARGFLSELIHWLRRAKKRVIVKEDASELLFQKAEALGKQLNAYINTIKKAKNK